MLGWAKGVFELEPPGPREANAQEILMEGFRRQDEFAEVKNRGAGPSITWTNPVPRAGSILVLWRRRLSLLGWPCKPF